MKTGGDLVACEFESHDFRSARVLLNTGPECLQVRLLLWVLPTRLGGQLAVHLGLEPGMLCTSRPPEPLKPVLVEQQECSPPCQGGGHGFKSHRGRLHGTVRKPVKRRSSNLRDRLWVRFPPVLLEQHALAGHWGAQLSVEQPPSGCAGSTPARRTYKTAR